jgi:hypothetical protein
MTFYVMTRILGNVVEQRVFDGEGNLKNEISDDIWYGCDVYELHQETCREFVEFTKS